MKIPEKINISGVEYTVNLSDEIIFTPNSHRAYGHISFENKVISIDRSLRDTQGHYHTLLHEILHGIVEDREIDFHQSDEESIIDQLAKGLFQVLRDNNLSLRE